MLRGIVSLAVLALLIATGVAVWLAVRPQGSATRADAKHVPSRHKAKAPRRERALRLPAVLPSRTRTVPILMYHRIDVLEPSLPPITHRLTVDPADFAAQMRWLKRNGFHPVTQLQLFDALERGTRLPSKPVMITFDDGYRDVYRNASAVLQRLHRGRGDAERLPHVDDRLRAEELGAAERRQVADDGACDEPREQQPPAREQRMAVAVEIDLRFGVEVRDGAGGAHPGRLYRGKTTLASGKA